MTADNDMAARHAAVWETIDSIASVSGYSVSGLAKASGHDATAFNRSKRKRGDDLRWPSMETVSRMLNVVGVSHGDFGRAIDAALKREGNDHAHQHSQGHL